jgi:F0F1-type ATP synthase membrane subunit b/b'
MSPEMRRLKNMLTKYQEIVGQYDKEKKKVAESEIRYRNSELTNHEYSKKMSVLEKKVEDQLAPIKKEISTIINLINGRKYSVLKAENNRGKY